MTTRDDLGSFFLKLAPELDADARKYGIKPVTPREAAERTAQYLRDNFDLHGQFSVQPEYAGMSGHDIVRTAEGDGYIDGNLKLRLEVTPTHRPYARYVASMTVPVRRGRVLRPSTLYPEGYEPLLCGQAAFDALAHADVGAGAWARNTRTAEAHTRTAAYPTETTLGGWMDPDEEAADARLASPNSVVVTVQANDGSGRPIGPAQSFSAPAKNMGEYPRAIQTALDEALNAVEIDGSEPQVAFVIEKGHPSIRIKTGMGLGPSQGVAAPGGFADTFVGGGTIVIQFVGDPVRGVDLKDAALEELYRVVVEPMLLGDAAALRQAAVESGRLPARQAAAYFDRSAQSAQTALAWAKMLVQIENQTRQAAEDWRPFAVGTTNLNHIRRSDVQNAPIQLPGRRTAAVANQVQAGTLLSDTRQRMGYTKGLNRWRTRYEA